MICNICGAQTNLVTTKAVGFGAHIVLRRRCMNGHAVQTHEVHTNMLADEREMSSALNNIRRRVKLFQRDTSIQQDPRPAAVLAEEHQITEARVRQIRASFIDSAPQGTSNSER